MLMSWDKMFFVKTLVSEEVEQMHHLLKQYHQVYINTSFSNCINLDFDLVLTWVLI